MTCNQPGKSPFKALSCALKGVSENGKWSSRAFLMGVWFCALMGTPSTLKSWIRRFLGVYSSSGQRPTSMFLILNRSEEILRGWDENCGVIKRETVIMVIPCTPLWSLSPSHTHTQVSGHFVFQNCHEVNISQFSFIICVYTSLSAFLCKALWALDCFSASQKT